MSEDFDYSGWGGRPWRARPEKLIVRDAEITRRVRSGETLKAVGDSLGLTKEAVRRVVAQADSRDLRAARREAYEAKLQALEIKPVGYYRPSGFGRVLPVAGEYLEREKWYVSEVRWNKKLGRYEVGEREEP